MLRSSLLLAAVIVTFCSTALAQNPRIRVDSPSTLQLNMPIERTLNVGQAHAFDVTVDGPSYIRFVVEQKGIDVIIRVTGPGGNSIGEFDSPNGDDGPENVSIVAPVTGTYRIMVAPLTTDGEPREGRFEIKLQELREATEDELKSSKNFEALRVKGRELLNDVESVIPEIRAADNRIRLQIQVARLLFPTDQKRALKLMNDAISNLKEMFTSIQTSSDDYSQDYANTKQLRIEVFEVLSAHDPEMALTFMRSTRSFMRPEAGQKYLDREETALEAVLANRLAGSDPKRAMQLAEEALKTGYPPTLSFTISQLRLKAPELAVQLAKQLTDKLVGEALLLNDEAAQLAMNLLRISHSARRSPTPNAPRNNASGLLLEENDFRALVQKTLNEVTAYKPGGSAFRDRNSVWTLLQGLKQLGPELETLIPGSVATVEKRLASLNSQDPNSAAVQQLQQNINTNSVDASLEMAAKAPQELRDQLYQQIAMRAAMAGDFPRAKQILTDNIANSFQRQQAISNLEQQAMYASLQKGKLDEAVRTVSNRRNAKERANLIQQVAGQIGPGLKKATAITALEQLRTLVGPTVQAEDQESINALLEISRSLSRYDAARAFEIIEPLVDQLNELSVAARTLNGFGQQYYKDGELIMQNGNSVAGVAIQLSTALGTLALANFDRAKLAADKIRVPEIRIIMYLQIAQQTMKTN
jgi:hypothetical protein